MNSYPDTIQECDGSTLRSFRMLSVPHGDEPLALYSDVAGSSSFPIDMLSNAKPTSVAATLWSSPPPYNVFAQDMQEGDWKTKLRKRVYDYRADIAVYSIPLLFESIFLYFVTPLTNVTINVILLCLIAVVPSIFLVTFLLTLESHTLTKLGRFGCAYRLACVALFCFAIQSLFTVLEIEYELLWFWLFRLLGNLALAASFLLDFSLSRRFCPGWEVPTICSIVLAVFIGAFVVSLLRVVSSSYSALIILLGCASGSMVTTACFRKNGYFTVFIAAVLILLSDLLMGINLFMLPKEPVLLLVASPLHLFAQCAISSAYFKILQQKTHS